MNKKFLQLFASSGAEASGNEADSMQENTVSTKDRGGEEKNTDAAAPEESAHSEPSENQTENDSDKDSETDKELTGEEKRNSAVKIAEDLIFRRAEENLSRYLRDESEKLREIYPSFSLENEMKNSPEFMHLLRSGVSLRRAFETVNLEKIMGSALRYAVMSAGKKTAETLRNSKRVAENSLQDSASSVMHTDVNSLTGKDIMRILSEVSKGAKISF